MTSLHHARASCLSPGTRVGAHEIVELLAIGGMAEIYIARSTQISDRIVALKRVLPMYASDDSFVAMFLDEARVASTLQHHGVAQVYDWGHDGNAYYYTMELLDGYDLSRVIRKVARGEIRPSFATTTAIGIAVASTLHYVHDKRDLANRPLGLVHRDISPSNIVVTYEGGVKIVDFGIAKSRIQRATTEVGTLKGKLSYVAPEQVRGVVDRRSDIYSLGTVLYELATGHRAFAGTNEAHTLHLVLAGEVTPPEELVDDLPPALAACISRAMSLDPEARYQTGFEFAAALERVAAEGGHSITPRTLGAWMHEVFGPPRTITIGNRRTSVAFAEADPAPASAPTTSVDPPRTRSSLVVAVAASIVAITLAAAAIYGGRDAPATPTVVPPISRERAPDSLGAALRVVPVSAPWIVADGPPYTPTPLAADSGSQPPADRVSSKRKPAPPREVPSTPVVKPTPDVAPAQPRPPADPGSLTLQGVH